MRKMKVTKHCVICNNTFIGRTDAIRKTCSSLCSATHTRNQTNINTKKYLRTPKGIARQKQWRDSPRGKAYQKQYRESAKHKTPKKLWLKSKDDKVSISNKKRTT